MSGIHAKTAVAKGSTRQVFGSHLPKLQSENAQNGLPILEEKFCILVTKPPLL